MKEYITLLNRVHIDNGEWLKEPGLANRRELNENKITEWVQRCFPSYNVEKTYEVLEKGVPEYVSYMVDKNGVFASLVCFTPEFSEKHGKKEVK